MSSQPPYAMAKLAAIEMGDAISKEYDIELLILCHQSLWTWDNFSELDSHVIPGLIFRMNEAKNNLMSFSVWGTYEPLENFYMLKICKSYRFYY